jgi:hypothetical protein
MTSGNNDQKLVLELIKKSFATFQPRTTLRSGCALDRHESIIKYDYVLDAPSADYIEKYIEGSSFLDDESLLAYFPAIMIYSLSANTERSATVIDEFFAILNPQGNRAALVKSLSSDQRMTILAFLKFISNPTRMYKCGDISDALCCIWDTTSRLPEE